MGRKNSPFATTGRRTRITLPYVQQLSSFFFLKLEEREKKRSEIKRENENETCRCRWETTDFAYVFDVDHVMSF